MISICNNNVWTAGDGDLSGPISYGGAILPIELLHFSAGSDGIFDILDWSTATEINNDYFTLYSSLDGETWTWLAQVRGAGTSSFTNNYDYSVPRSLNDRVLYRLDQTDFDGTSKTVGQPESQIDLFNATTAQVNIFPNPSMGVVNVMLPSIPRNGRIDILSPDGSVLYQWNDIQDQSFKVDFNALALPKGTYLIKIGMEESVFVKRILFL